MRIDLPQCGFKHCRFQADGNCLHKLEFQRCEHVRACETLESIISSQKLCILCQNSICKNSSSREENCHAIWNGLMEKDHNKSERQLTIEELYKMDGQPILLETGEVPLLEQLIAKWEILISHNDDTFFFTRRTRGFLAENYGKTWLAYRYEYERDERNKDVYP